MRHLLASLALGTALLAAPAFAAADVLDFDALDSVFVGPGNSSADEVTVTGRLAGEASSVTMTLYANSYFVDRLERCYRLALMALNKPGRWRFTVDGQRAGNRVFATRCGVTRID
jgi:hypothetical protein